MMYRSRLDQLQYLVAGAYLAIWARLVLARRRPRIVGVTGSVGKTGTKNLIAEVLMHPAAEPFTGVVWKARGNLNSNAGLPLAVLGFGRIPQGVLQWCSLFARVPFRAIAMARDPSYPSVLVLEYAAAWRCDVPFLAWMAPPTVAVVTAIGPAHLDRFGTVERVAAHKAALVRAVPASGLVVLGADTQHSAAMHGLSLAPVELVPGRGATLSAGVARAVAAYFGVPEPVVTAALAAAAGTAGRLQTREAGTFTVIDDAFNANPLSMRLALDTLAERAVPGQRRVAILGGMAQLGPSSVQYHREIAAYVRQRADLLVGVGALAADFAADRWFRNVAECEAQLGALLRAGDCVLVKGSHSVGLKRIARMLTESETAELPGAPGARSPSHPLIGHDG